MTQHPTQDRQSEIKEILANHRGRVLTYSELFRKEHHAIQRYEADLAHSDIVALQEVEAYVTTRVKEALTSLRNKTSQNPQWPKDYKFARSQYDIAINQSIKALTTTTNGKEE